MREEGYYWVKDDGKWVVAQWTGFSWYLFTSDDCYKDIAFEETDERRIERPDESSLFISVEYLMELHPELTKQAAKELKEFASDLTIDYKDCYGKGEIVYPKWLEIERSKITT